jgi:hypothetical protein
MKVISDLSEYNITEMEKDVNRDISLPVPMDYAFDVIESLETQTQIRRIRDIVHKHITKSDRISQEEFISTFISQQDQDFMKKIMKITAFIAATQEHKFTHHGSCFKQKKLTGCKFLMCRYKYPKQPTPQSHIGSTDNPPDPDDFELYYKRPPGSNYVNKFPLCILPLTKSNIDVNYLDMKTAHYAVKYVAKVQDFIDSEAVVEKFNASIARAYRNCTLAEANNPDMTLHQKGARKLYSFAYHYSNYQEVSVTLAAYSMLRDSIPMICSHDVAILILISGLRAVHNQDQV